MKNFLTLIIFFLIGYVSNVTAATLTAEEKYIIGKEIIVANCTLDANYVKKIAEQRDAGVPKNGVINWIINSVKREMVMQTLDPPLKTTDVLNQVMLVTVIYSNPNITPDEIYEQQHSFCTKTFFVQLDVMYEYEKRQLK